MKLRVWWIPQIPGKPFHKEVRTLTEGKLILDTLAEYDLFQLHHGIKPDYSNVGGLQEFSEEDHEWQDYEPSEEFVEYAKTKFGDVDYYNDFLGGLTVDQIAVLERGWYS